MLDFLVIGAQKCATSWLYYCLCDHPQVHLPDEKLERKYLGGRIHEEKGDEWYMQYVGGGDDGQINGDISVNYLCNPRSPEVIHDVIGNVNLIASLRSPVDRCISSYLWNLRRGNVRELKLSMGLLQAVREWELLSQQPTYIPENYYFNIVARGMYAKQLQKYVDKFGLESLYLLYYEDIRERPLDTLRRLYRTLGVDPNFHPSSLTRRPKQNSYLRPLLRLEHATPNTAFWGKATDIAHQVVTSIGLGQERPSLSDEVEERLLSLYAPSNEQLTDLVRRLPRSNVLTPGDPVPPWTTESS